MPDIKQVQIGKVYKLVSDVIFPEYIVPTQKLIGTGIAKYKYIDLSFGYEDGTPISEYDLLGFYKLVKGKDG